MAGSTSKKVVVVRFDRDPIAGYVSPDTYRQHQGIEVLTSSGSILQIPYSEIKSVCFVKSWEVAPFGKERREFTSRPKTEGLWVRFDFRDGDSMESLIPNRLHELEETGFMGTPPDASSNTQRIFVPRAGLKNCIVLGVIGVARKPQRKNTATADQLTMFSLD